MKYIMTKVKGVVRVLNTFIRDHYRGVDKTLCTKIDGVDRCFELVDPSSEMASNVRYKVNDTVKAIATTYSLVVSYFKRAEIKSPAIKKIMYLTGQTSFTDAVSELSFINKIKYIPGAGLYVMYGKWDTYYNIFLSFSKDCKNWNDKYVGDFYLSTGGTKRTFVEIDDIYYENEYVYVAGVCQDTTLQHPEESNQFVVLKLLNIFDTSKSAIDVEVITASTLSTAMNYKGTVCNGTYRYYLYTRLITNYSVIFRTKGNEVAVITRNEEIVSISYNIEHDSVIVYNSSGTKYRIINTYYAIMDQSLVRDNQTEVNGRIMGSNYIINNGVKITVPYSIVGFAPEYNTWYAYERIGTEGMNDKSRIYYCTDLTANQWTLMLEVYGTMYFASVAIDD